tara:strand:- start:113 stop:448 length:336 start_codon:yes stop_codon:yes gene_type:complete
MPTDPEPLSRARARNVQERLLTFDYLTTASVIDSPLHGRTWRDYIVGKESKRHVIELKSLCAMHSSNSYAVLCGIIKRVVPKNKGQYSGGFETCFDLSKLTIRTHEHRDGR